MRCFVLCTGRCGSKTFAAALGHLPGWTVGHETRADIGDMSRLGYPDQHAEVDNRLSWFLGGLETLYGDDPVYVHLQREPAVVSVSYARRTGVRGGIMRAFTSGVILQPFTPDRVRPASRLMVWAMNENIRAFLRDKTRVHRIDIEEPHGAFTRLWTDLGGPASSPELDAALREFEVIRNATPA